MEKWAFRLNATFDRDVAYELALSRRMAGGPQTSDVSEVLVHMLAMHRRSLGTGRPRGIVAGKAIRTFGRGVLEPEDSGRQLMPADRP